MQNAFVESLRIAVWEADYNGEGPAFVPELQKLAACTAIFAVMDDRLQPKVAPPTARAPPTRQAAQAPDPTAPGDEGSAGGHPASRGYRPGRAWGDLRKFCAKARMKWGG